MASGSVIRYRGKHGVVFRIKYRDATGVQVMETVGAERDGMNEKNAREVLADRLSDVRRKGYRRPAPLTFAEYAARWYQEAAVRRDWKPRTVMQNKSVERRLVAWFGPMRLAAIRPAQVSAYATAMLEDGYGPATVKRDLGSLHDLFKTALREGLAETNPAAGVEHPKKPRRRWRILTPAEVGAVLRAFDDDQAQVMFLTLVLTGVRRGELLDLRWRDVDLVDNVVRVEDSKTEEGIRSIALGAGLAEALWQHRRRSHFQGDDELVFCHPERGTRMLPQWFSKQFAKAREQAGIRDYVRPFHDLRHTAITQDAVAGTGPVALMAKAGHTDMATTKIYLHLAGTVFREEAAALERRMLGEAGLSTKVSTDLS
jgi:integrase